MPGAQQAPVFRQRHDRPALDDSLLVLAMFAARRFANWPGRCRQDGAASDLSIIVPDDLGRDGCASPGGCHTRSFRRFLPT
jgi:hypothetical protein